MFKAVKPLGNQFFQVTLMSHPGSTHEHDGTYEIQFVEREGRGGGWFEHWKPDYYSDDGAEKIKRLIISYQELKMRWIQFLII